VNDPYDPFPQLNPPCVGARELFARALHEIDELGGKPRSGPSRWHWEEERRGSMNLLATLAGHDGHLLQRAALYAVGNRRNQRAASLLRDATRFAWRG
jgi:hypothetical protein